MTIQLTLSPAVKRAFCAVAKARGLSVDALASGMLSAMILDERQAPLNDAGMRFRLKQEGGLTARVPASQRPPVERTLELGRRPRLIITTPRPTREEIIASTGITPEELREVDESLQPFLKKWGPLPELRKKREQRVVKGPQARKP